MHKPIKWLSVDVSKRVYIKSCMLGHTDKAYLNSMQQCPLTSGWTMLNSQHPIRWLTLQRRQGCSLICNWANGGQAHRISSKHWVLQFVSMCVYVCARVCMIAQCCPSPQDHANRPQAAAHICSALNKQFQQPTNDTTLLQNMRNLVGKFLCKSIAILQRRFFSRAVTLNACTELKSFSWRWPSFLKVMPSKEQHTFQACKMNETE